MVRTTKRRYYMTTISVVVISDKHLEYDNLEDLNRILSDCIYPSELEEPFEEELTAKEAAEYIVDMKGEPNWLNLTADGEEL